YDDAEVQAERLHLRKRRGRPERDRAQEWEHVSLDTLRERPTLAWTALGRPGNADPCAREPHAELVAPQSVLLFLERDDRPQPDAVAGAVAKRRRSFHYGRTRPGGMRHPVGMNRW